MSPTVRLSVIVPAYRGESVLKHSLPALAASDLPRHEWELIVVDDASPDATASVAADFADHVIRLEGSPRGPAFARNAGIRASRGEIVVFVDADVCLHVDALGRTLAAFDRDPGLAAVFGSYDADPHAPGMVSQFRNLLHHHVHTVNAGPAETFWAGCGAVRRQTIIDVGLMDAERYPRPQIEDIELGRRLRRAGHRILLSPDIRCSHLKRWTLRNMVVTDFRDRGVPWMKLILGEGASAGSSALNLRRSERAAALLAGVAAIGPVAAVALRSWWLAAIAMAAVAGLVILNRGFYRLLRDTRGASFAAMALPLHILYYLTAGSAAAAAMLDHVATRAARRRVVESQPPRYHST